MGLIFELHPKHFWLVAVVLITLSLTHYGKAFRSRRTKDYGKKLKKGNKELVFGFIFLSLAVVLYSTPIFVSH